MKPRQLPLGMRFLRLGGHRSWLRLLCLLVIVALLGSYRSTQYRNLESHQTGVTIQKLWSVATTMTKDEAPLTTSSRKEGNLLLSHHRAQLCERLNVPKFHRQRPPDVLTAEMERLEANYALRETILKHTGLVRRPLQSRFLEKVMANADANADEPVMTVWTLGGSFTRGHGCGEQQGDDERECAWPRRLERWWKHAFNNTNSHWEHLADHSITSVSALQRIGVMVKTLPTPDLVILDHLVNDAGEGNLKKGTIGYESLIRRIRTLLPFAQILLIEDGCQDCIEPGGTRALMLHRRRQIAAHYSLPLVDYAAMVQHHNLNRDGQHQLWPMTDPPIDGPYIVVGVPWPDFVPPLNTTQVMCCPNNHPPWPVHQYYADAIAYGLVQMLQWDLGCIMESDKDQNHTTRNQLDESEPLSLPVHVLPLPPPFYESSQLAEFSRCDSPLVDHDAMSRWSKEGGSTTRSSINTIMAPNSTSNSQLLLDPVVIRGNWTLYEDRPGRPGWISTQVGSILRFPVQFGSIPMLAVTYLRSYETMGNANLYLSARTNASVRGKSDLEGYWDTQYSLPDTTYFVESPNGWLLSPPLDHDGYNTNRDKWMEENGIYMLDVEHVWGEKFKILQVASC